MPADDLLSIRGLRIAFGDREPVEVVHGLDLDVAAGEVVAIVGESGSGKSVTAMAVLGLLPAGARVSGSVTFAGRDLLGLSAAGLRKVRGSEIAMIFQDPVAALNPVFTIGFQLVEAIRAHDRTLNTAAARRRAVELLALVELAEPERALRRYPHELSGGMCQRVVIAMALAAEPRLLIADEPTTALDVTVQAEVLDVLSRLGRRIGSGILLITHDMGVVAELADRVVVMRDGAVVETGEAVALFADPRAEYTRQLLAAVPRIGRRGEGDDLPPDVAVLDIRGLVVEYGGRLRGIHRAVDGVDLRIGRGEILGLVGESGSGKSTIGKAAIGIAPVALGTVTVGGTDLVSAARAERRAMRRQVGVVFQNPAQSLNPRYPVATTVSEPLRVIRGLRGSELADATASLLASVGLTGMGDRYPHELSGGQRQRAAIARAVALDPVLLIADEPTSALDVSVQAQVLDVFRELQSRLGFACLFISHDLAVVDELCDRVAVMCAGRIVEQGTRRQVLDEPGDEYTRRLLASAPVPDPVEQRRRRAVRLGEPPAA